MATTIAMKQRDTLLNSVYKLLDDYYRFGHLYDQNGKLKERYFYIYEYEDGYLYDICGKRLDIDPFYELDDYGDDNIYLWVHSNNGFTDLEWNDVLELSAEDILDKYLSGQTKKLVGMLKNGRNYATQKGFGMQYNDRYLAQTIAFIWKMFAIRQIECRDIKRKFRVKGHDYYKDSSVTYKWDERPYSGQISEPSDYVKKPASFIKDTLFDEAYAAFREKAIKEQNEIAAVIALAGASNDFLNEVQQALEAADNADGDGEHS